MSAAGRSSHGKYTILRKIADGGMAEIFLARLHGAQGFQKLVVLKRIRRSFSSDPQFRRMLVGEAHVAMGLNHSNIVQILDLGEAGGDDFLAFELVDGWSLDQLLKRATAAGFPLPRALGLHIVIETLRGLAYAHAKSEAGRPLSIVHRDVSPQNILVSAQGEVKLTDFGIAKARNRTERTAKGVVKGKIAFMSPEQAVGAPLDARSDLFSLGTVLYLLATGRHPFQAGTDLETMVRVQACEFVSPAKLKPRVEPELTRLILRAMDREPARRFQSAEAMLEASEKVLRGDFPDAGPTELRRWLERLSQADGAQPIGRAAEEAMAPEAEPSEPPLVLSDSDLLPLEPPPLPARAHGRRRSVVPWALGGAALVCALVLSVSARRGPPPARSGPPLLSPSLDAGPPPALPPSRPLASVTPDAGGTAVTGLTPADAGTPPTLAMAPPDAGPSAQVQEAGVDGGAQAALSTASPAPQDAGSPEEPVVEDEPSSVAPGPLPTPAAPVAAPAAPRPTQERDGRVSVLVRSVPAGATVRLKTRTFGKTPLHLRFRPGLTYELSFLLDGYREQARRLEVGPRAGQEVVAYLHKGKGPSAPHSVQPPPAGRAQRPRPSR